MTIDFDTTPNRRLSESGKWGRYPEDVLPMWVADMDFYSPEPVIRALRERVEHGVFGYPMPIAELYEVIAERMATKYDWHISTEDIVVTPGVVVGFNMACHAVASPGGEAFLQTPVYYPMLSAPKNAGLIRKEMELTRCEDGSYEIDFDKFEESITESTKIFLLCSPHNPVGRVLRKDELSRMAEICMRKNVVICSDEIHCDLVFRESQHCPTASIDPEVAQNTITLMAPSKTYNIPGLTTSFAIIQNPELRARYQAAAQGLVGHPSIMGWIGTLAAFRDCQSWLDELLLYLEANRDFLYDYVKANLPEIKMAKPEGTYLAWLDCRSLNVGNPHEYFLEKAKVALNDGATFGKGGEGFVRMNFGCSRSTLVEGLEKIKNALANYS